MKSMYNLFEESKNYVLYCDMDGVLTDFDKSARKLDQKIYEYPPEKMWKIIQDAGPEFWEQMDWLEGGKELWNYIINHNPQLLTALPGLSENDITRHHAHDGKRKWVIKNLGDNYLKKLILTTSPEKKNYATRNSILIDDNDKLIREWNENGGIGILHLDSIKTIKKLSDYF